MLTHVEIRDMDTKIFIWKISIERQPHNLEFTYHCLSLPSIDTLTFCQNKQSKGGFGSIELWVNKGCWPGIASKNTYNLSFWQFRDKPFTRKMITSMCHPISFQATHTHTLTHSTTTWVYFLWSELKSNTFNSTWILTKKKKIRARIYKDLIYKAQIKPSISNVLLKLKHIQCSNDFHI